jgi:SAM-dependent methyltransferase
MTAAPTIHSGCVLRCPGRPFLEVDDNQGAVTTRLVQCPACSLVFESPRPTTDAIARFYADTALWTNSTDAEGNRRSYVNELEQKRRPFGELATRIRGRKSSGRLLDVGSGPGLLELELPEFDVVGLEPCAYIAEVGTAHLHTHIEQRRLEDADFPEASFDVVVMKYVLDHMEEPFAALTRARQLLRPDGLLVIADLINIESFCARFFREGFRLIHPMHFTYFAPKTITAHLERAGFSVERIEFPFFRTGYFTPRTVATLVARLARRSWYLATNRRHLKVISPPWYGNMMDVWARPA